MAEKPLTVAWISYFPVEWLPDAPPETRLPKQHPTTWLRSLADEFAGRAELRLHVVVTRKQFPRDVTFERNGVTFHCLKVRGGLRAPSLFWTDTFRIRQAVTAIKPDLVHAWGTEGGAALIASRLKLPYLVTIQGLLGWYARCAPLGRYLHFMAMLEKIALRRARVATAESTFAVDYTRRQWPNLDVKRVEVVSGWEFHRIVRRPPPDRIRLLMVGALEGRKGGDVLLRAFGHLRGQFPLELVVVGRADPACVDPVRGQLPPGTWEAVQFRHDLTSAQIAEELAEATIAACPTRADTGPMFAKEAVVAGVPLVGSRVGGLPDYVQPGRNGFLCEPGDADDFTRALEQACRHPEFRSGRVELEVQERLRRELTPSASADGFLARYRETLAAYSVR